MGTRALAALALVGVLVAAGCSDDPEPKIAAPTPSNVTSSPSSNESPVVSQGDPELAVIDDFFSAFSASISSGDTSQMATLALPSCVNCQVLADNVESAYADGGYILDGGVTVRTAEFSEAVDEGRVWEVEIETAAERWFDRSDKLVKNVSASKQTVEVLLVVDKGAWRVGELRVTK